MKRLLYCLYLVLCSGCVPQMVLNSMDRKHYLDYRNTAEQTNLEREKAGLTPIAVMTPEQWKASK